MHLWRTVLVRIGRVLNYGTLNAGHLVHTVGQLGQTLGLGLSQRQFTVNLTTAAERAAQTALITFYHEWYDDEYC